MVLPWLEAGYDAVTVDLQDAEPLPATEGVRHHLKLDVRNRATIYERVLYAGIPTAVFAFPPCTHLASSGARWWQDKGLGALIEGLGIVEACRLTCEGLGCPWIIENPVGALATHWRRPDHQFSPCDLAGWGPRPETEAYTKKTCFWIGGGFIMPKARPVEPIMGSAMHAVGQCSTRADDRSVTPLGLAYGVFDANEPGLVARRAAVAPFAI